jgi:hypothetical protein
MSANGKAGHGRGNNRKKPFRRRENDNDVWQRGDFSGWDSNRQADNRWSETGSAPGKAPDRVLENQSGRNTINKKSGERGPYFERPKWIPPKLKADAFPVSDCPWCGRPIRDISSAIADKDTGVPVHFDCVISRITFGERLEKGESVTYIGAGRFGIICFDNSEAQLKSDHFQAAGRQEQNRKSIGTHSSGRDFIIKKIIEWENKDKRAEWRSVICDHYSVI